MDFKYENIVVGSDLRAMLYAFINQYPIFFTELNKPHEFDFLETKLSEQNVILKSFTKNYKFGEQKVDLWDKIYFLLSIKGLIPLSRLCDTIRHDGSKLICSNEYMKLCTVNFDKCYYFGDKKTYKLVNERKHKNARYKVYDKIAFRSGGKHDIDYFETDDNFVHKVWFYSSDRICGNTGVKDAYVLSILTDEQLRDSSYTETMCRFKLMSIMKDKGLRGKQNGYNKYGTPRFYDFKTKNMSRTKIKIDDNKWCENSKVKKVDTELENLIKFAKNMNSENYYFLDGNCF
mgnify:CR=1 FL=1|tara:strand:+ start:1441 stop:2307 length:867 start_codon:yes stop_codon:yes gene_type:complete